MNTEKILSEALELGTEFATDIAAETSDYAAEFASLAAGAALPAVKYVGSRIALSRIRMAVAAALGLIAVAVILKKVMGSRNSDGVEADTLRTVPTVADREPAVS